MTPMPASAPSPDAAPVAPEVQTRLRPHGATFVAPEMERLYRLEQLQVDAQQAQQAMLAVSLAVLALSVTDWRLFGSGANFWLLFSPRFLLLVLSVAAGLSARRAPEPRQLDWLLVSWTAALVVVDLFVVSSRPPESLGHIMIHPVMVLLIYVALPLPLRLQVLCGALFTLAYLWLLNLVQPAWAPEVQAALAASLIAANLLGFVTARRQQLTARRSFTVLAHMAQSGAEADRRSITDSLTGLLNRRGWDERLWAIDEQCRVSGRIASVIAIDLDGLKQVNDTQGHAQGDALIVNASRCLRQASRGGDILACLGGDRFAVLAVDCDQPGIATLVSRIEGCLVASGIAASFSHATATGDASLAAAWDQAGRAMNLRKRARRPKAGT